jgi:hypothetical protein
LGVSGDVGAEGTTSQSEVGEARSRTVEQPQATVEVDLATGAAPAPADEPAEPPEGLIADVPAVAQPPVTEPPVAETPAEARAEAGPEEGQEAAAPKPARRPRARRVASATPTRTRTRRSA